MYVHGAVLTPKYGLKWLTHDREAFSKQELVSAIESHIIKHPIKQENITTSLNQTETQPPKAKKLKIMSFLDDEDEEYLVSLSTNNRRNVQRQVDEYL